MPAPRPAISICCPPLEGPHLTPSLSTAWADSGQCMAATPAGFFLASADYAGGFSCEFFLVAPVVAPSQKHRPPPLKMPAKSLIFLVPQEGFEPPTPSLRIR